MNTKNISKKRLEMAIFSKLDEELTEENKNIKLLTAYTLILYQKQKEEFILKKLIALTDELLKLKISQEELKENLEIFENDKLYELDNYTLDMLLDHYNEFFDEEKLNNKYKKHPLFQEIITSLNSIKEEQKELEKEIELKKEKLKIRDNDFKELTISLLNIEDLSKNIKEKIDEQQKYLEELSKKVETINKKMVEETFLVCINDMVDNMNDFIIKFGLGSLLFGSLGGVVASEFGINELAKGLKESFKLERRTRIIYECTDYEYEIIRNIDNVKYANNLVIQEKNS